MNKEKQDPSRGEFWKIFDAVYMHFMQNFRKRL